VRMWATSSNGKRIFHVRVLRASAVFVGALSLAACAGGTGQPTAASTTPPPVSSSAAASAQSPSPSASATGVQNLVLTDAIRAQLVAAAASLNGLPASAYLGLVHGFSYYGFDPATNTYWAGGQLDPSPSSQQAQVSVQDDGSYYIFKEPAGGSWTASAEGMAGIGGSVCSVQIPPALVALWGWPAGACRPTGS
jgi:hypothetical protein